MADPKAELPPALRLFSQDLALILKLLPRAQIVVGDIPAIYPSLQRLELAVQSGANFVENRPNVGTEEAKG